MLTHRLQGSREPYAYLAYQAFKLKLPMTKDSGRVVPYYAAEDLDTMYGARQVNSSPPKYVEVSIPGSIPAFLRFWARCSSA